MLLNKPEIFRQANNSEQETTVSKVYTYKSNYLTVSKPAINPSSNSGQAPQIAAVFAAKYHTIPDLSIPQNKCSAMYSIPKGVTQWHQHPKKDAGVGENLGI